GDAWCVDPRARPEHAAAAPHRRNGVRADRRGDASEGDRRAGRGTRSGRRRVQGLRGRRRRYRARTACHHRRAFGFDGRDHRGAQGGERVVTYGAYGVEDSVKVTTTAAKAKTPPE